MNTHAMIQAEHTADRIRSELFRTLEEIDRRRHEAMDWRAQVRNNWKLLAAAGGVLVAAVVAKTLIGRRVQRKQAEHAATERWQSARRAWKHPDRIAPARQSAALDFGTKVLTIFGSAIASQLAKRAATRVVG